MTVNLHVAQGPAVLTHGGMKGTQPCVSGGLVSVPFLPLANSHLGQVPSSLSVYVSPFIK